MELSLDRERDLSASYCGSGDWGAAESLCGDLETSAPVGGGDDGMSGCL